VPRARLTARSRARGTGRLALLAENPRSLERYRRLGFRPMAPVDRPLELVPAGPDGHSVSVRRVADGRPGLEEARCPWLVLEARLAAARAPGDAMGRTG